ncbi:probable leucine-rich repeat receptor-like protein kinase At5g49770 [Amborella trichopoda]|uniref:non-specific serine/threonine protein kinase n=1 Tax=Amborella trichopoda TaxID=13333 RepID=W1NYP2_AMBTC|nr:probable leucine-rich repeat receptor-like protein kinase At5g49770 [Amborella trichopoda]ERM99804.1 hypothetical protein AMTR_s00099p00159710 [Amborella trichopoda]|eukprot:XP_020519077.1 probable leucine-rich repeat receptor-like protein kinase At5g49770 [Amborella trichopoda]
MGPMGWPCIQFFVILCQLCAIYGQETNPFDGAVLTSLQNVWQNVPPTWKGGDPCLNQWDGISCNGSRVTAIKLSTMGLKGTLTGDIGSLSELQYLDLSYNKDLTGSLPQSIGNLKKLTNLILVGCSFSGTIPAQIGSLQELVFLSLNSNGFTGEIPPSIGSLSKLYWLDLADNQLTGSIPISTPTSPGLDMLLGTRHFHFNRNKLSGSIPTQLFSSAMTVIHILFDGNNFSGKIPSSIGLVTSLEVLRLDRNKFEGPVPANLNNLTKIQELSLAQNALTGPLPNLTGMNVLAYLDLSNNSFDATEPPPWLPTLQSLTTIVMESIRLQGELPQAVFTIPPLQMVKMRNNNLNGTIDIGSNFTSQLNYIDLENNDIQKLVSESTYKKTFILVGNPACDAQLAQSSYCDTPKPLVPYSTPQQNCAQDLCPPTLRANPTCGCAAPYTGTLVFRAPLFSDTTNTTLFQSLEVQLQTKLHVPPGSVSLQNPTMDSESYMQVQLYIFPTDEQQFNRSEVSTLGFRLSNQTFKPPPSFGPFFFIANPYYFPEVEQSKQENNSLIIGLSVGGAVLVLIFIIVALFAFERKRKAERPTGRSSSFVSWNPSDRKNSGSALQLKGAKWFTYEELRKCSDNFAEANGIGSGGYGRVYRGVLPTGQMVAIKRAEQGYGQGDPEFRMEIELLSRVHHRNLVTLIGFCFEQGEQILVYEYFPNGTLRESLSGKSGVRLDWKRRLRVALGSARGLAYLHEHADPPIIHRDVKPNNILLDENLNAKVADFGLSKPIGDRQCHVTTQVKGTLGYLDPEYYMTQQLTAKSDVYSFGVLMLEMLSGKPPIERGRYIVREVKLAMDKTKDLYGLHELLDPTVMASPSLPGFERYVDLALKCVGESDKDRPNMSEVVREMEEIISEAGLSTTTNSAATSATFAGSARGTPHHPYNDPSFDYSGAFPPSTPVEPK